MLWANNRWCHYIIIQVCQSTGPWVCCVFVCVCYQIRAPPKKPHYVSELSKLDALLPKIHIKILLVLKFQGWTCVDPQQKEQWEWRLEVTGKWGKWLDKIWKMRVGNIGGLQKIGELVLLCQLFEETLKISHPSHYKTNRPPFLASLPFPVKIFHPPITAIFQKSNPPRGVQTMICLRPRSNCIVLSPNSKIIP